MIRNCLIKSIILFCGIFSVALAQEIPANTASGATPVTTAQPAQPIPQTTVTPQPAEPIPQTNVTSQLHPTFIPAPTVIPSAPDINAKAYVLMDAGNGNILAQSNMDQKLPPASLTKMMTLYLASKALASGQIHLDDPVTISEKAWKTGGSKMFIRVGTQVSVQDLLMGIIVQSGNDACVALSEYIAGTEDAFVQMMNAEAQALGMTNTHYVDCTGLQEPDHYSTAHDLAILARHIILDYPQYYGFYKEKWFKFNNIRQPNRNRLLWRFAPFADGIKTGHTDAAGFCLVGSAIQNGTRLITVVLGSHSDEARADASKALFIYGFHFFESHLVYQANSQIANPRVWYGSNKYVPAGVTEDYYVTIPKGQYDNVQIKVAVNTNIQAPIQKNQSVGTITATLNGNVIATTPLVALQDDPKGGFFRHLMDFLSHLFSGWFTPKAK